MGVGACGLGTFSDAPQLPDRPVESSEEEEGPVENGHVAVGGGSSYSALISSLTSNGGQFAAAYAQR